ncbi:MAG: TonB family protein [Caulobacterales bacterium]
MRSAAVALAALVWAAASPTISAPTATSGNGASARPDVSLPIEGVVTDPDWIQLPGPDQFSNYFPRMPWMLSLSGIARVKCSVSALGMLENCSILSESPTGMGFGDAALALTPYFRMRPRSIDGTPVGGGEVNIPIRFRAAPPPTPADSVAETPPTPQPPARALELARKLAAAAHWGDNVRQTNQQYLEQIRKNLGAENLSAEQTIALKALEQAMDASGEARIERQEADLATAFTERQLGDLLAFYESPTGQAWFERSQDFEKSDQQASYRLWPKLIGDARQRFCQQVACLIDAPPTEGAAPAK